MFFTKLLFLTHFLVMVFDHISAARILAVYPFPSVSHQVVFRVLSTELANRGHELVVITTDLSASDGKPHPNITEIDVHDTYKVFGQFLHLENTAGRGVKITADQLSVDNYKFVQGCTEMLFENLEVKALLNDKAQKFDLVITEALLNIPLIFAKIFNTPAIWFSTLHGSNSNYYALGAPTVHPFLYPNFYRNKFNNLTIWEKLYEIYVDLRIRYIFGETEKIEDTFLDRYFGEGFATVHELRNLIDLLFLNTNPIFEGNRPVPPNVIHLGSLHMKPTQLLTEDINSYLNSSINGVIYVSFGSNVKSSSMTADLLEVFLRAFELLPYDILWKFDGDSLPRDIKNLRTSKWLPQRDLLHHPNLRAFVTQCGIQSTDEAIDAGVPLIGIPLIAEQSFNAARYVKLGIGVNLDVITLTTDQLIEAVENVVRNESYKNNIKHLKTLMRDQPESPLERAVWWTEYVLRHGGAKHLRSPAANISWTEYIMLDVLAVVFTILFIFVVLVVLLIIYEYIMKFLLNSSQKKLKKN